MARPASDIQERIVRAAREGFMVDGVEGASLRGIARAAGTNLGMVYYYFPTKDDLFLAVVEEAYGKLLADLERVLAEAGGTDTPTMFGRLYARLAALSDDESMMVRLMFREAMSTDSGRLVRLFERFSRGHIPLVLSAIQGGIASGELRADLPPFALVLSTLVLGLFPQLLRRRLVEAGVPTQVMLPGAEALADVLTRVLLEGIASRQPEK